MSDRPTRDPSGPPCGESTGDELPTHEMTPDEPTANELTAWWAAVQQAALFGTARRDPPAPPAGLPHRTAATPEVALLDAAALGAALLSPTDSVSASLPPEPLPAESLPVGGFEPAPPDRLAEPPDRARQLLELILTQSPAGRRLQRPLLEHWLRSAADAGCRAPRRWLPQLIDLGSDRTLRPLLAAVADARGTWLAGLRSDWSWLLDPTAADDAVDPQAWLQQPTAARVETVRRLRHSDPDAARELVAAALPTDSAADRATLLGCLEIGLGPADEPLVEAALDDRSDQVRQVAYRLLDGLPGSARAARMTQRLAPLLRLTGGPAEADRTVGVQLPTTPDAAGVRDGLGKPPVRRSERGYWLEQLAAGAPLDTWTRVSGRDPAGTFAMITDEDARVGIVRAVLARRDADWARALAPQVDLPALLALLPADERDEIAARRVLRAGTRPDFGPVLIMIRTLPPPWGPAFSRAVLEVVHDHPRSTVAPVITELAAGLHPSVVPQLQDLAAYRRGFGEAEAARHLLQYLTLIPEIAEAFR